jgi:hypothetical protein
MSARTSRGLWAAALLVAAIAVLVHPAAGIAAGALAGAGYLAAALMRRAEERRGEALDVAEWIEAHSFSSDTAAELVAELRGVNMADLRSRVAARAYDIGREHEADAQHERRSEAARKAAVTRARRCQPARSRRP